MRRTDPFHRYVLNLLGRFGNRVELLLGAEASVRAAPTVFVQVDERDGFEVAFFSCTSAASQQARISSVPSPAA